MLRAAAEPGRSRAEILAITFTKRRRAGCASACTMAAHFARASPDSSSPRAGNTRNRNGPILAAWGLSRRAIKPCCESGQPVQVRTFHSWFAALLHAPLAVLQRWPAASYDLLEDDAEAVAAVWKRFQATVVHEPAAAGLRWTPWRRLAASCTQSAGGSLAKRVEIRAWPMGRRGGCVGETCGLTRSFLNSQAGLPAMAAPWALPVLLEPPGAGGTRPCKTWAAGQDP